MINQVYTLVVYDDTASIKLVIEAKAIKNLEEMLKKIGVGSIITI